jgi:ABC-type multidrug transport system fused ATPase/permease subunit
MFISSKVVGKKVLVISNFVIRIFTSNRLISVSVLLFGSGAALTQGLIVIFLNNGLTGTDGVAKETSESIPPYLVIALGLIVVTAWLQHLSTRFVMLIWIARRNQNLERIEYVTQKIRTKILDQLKEEERKSLTHKVTKLLLLLRSLNNRQGLAVRTIFGIITAMLGFVGITIAALTINMPITLLMLGVSLVGVLPVTAYHASRVAATNQDFRTNINLSTRKFEEAVSVFLTDSENTDMKKLQYESHHIHSNQALFQRITIPSWNRLTASTLLVGVFIGFIWIGGLLSYPLPPGGTIFVLFVALMAALAQIASISGQITVLGRFIHDIENFEKGIRLLKNARDEIDVDSLLVEIQGKSADTLYEDEVSVIPVIHLPV